MSATDRTDHAGMSWETKLKTAAGLALIAATGITYASLWIGYTVNGWDTTGLFGAARSLSADWSPASTIAAVCLSAGLALAVWVFLRLKDTGASDTADMDRAGSLMATDRQLRGLTTAGRAKATKSKGITAPALPHMFQTLSGKWIDVGPESTATMIAGPRGGKTSSFAVPRIVEWDGPVVVTSNKRDLVDVTAAWRERDGGTAWVFDPQGIINEDARVSWYWDPITAVAEGNPARMDVRAATLAHRFAFAAGSTKSGTPDYFTQSGQGLLASLILAAACERRTVIEMLDWITTPTKAPARSLRDNGFTRVANNLESIVQLNPDQRDGIYGTAVAMTEFLTFKSVEAWVTPGEGRTEFRPHEFVRSHDTLYSISRENTGSMGPLVTALTAAVCDAAEEHAQRSPGGRLAVPMGLVLDEVANVCRWSDLPNLYSHYGSKGILPMAFLQSWNQGVEVWGEQGMGKLWSASTTRVVGPGIAENGFHGSVTEMIGEHTKVSRSRSNSDAGESVSVQNTREKILDTADLTALPAGRVIVAEAGHRAAYLKAVPWFERKYAKALKAVQA